MATGHFGLISFLRRWWPFVALVTVAGALLAYMYGIHIDSTYEAEAQILVEAGGGEDVQTAAALAPTYAELVRTGPVLGFAIESSRAPLSAAELRPNVRGESEIQTRLLKIRVRDGDATRVVTLANGLAAGLVRYVAARQAGPGTEGGQRVRLRIVEPASAAHHIRPQLHLVIGFGAIAGFFSALSIATLVVLRSRTVRDEQDLAGVAGVDLFGSVNGGPLSPRLVRSLAVPMRNPAAELESYRGLARRIAVANGDVMPRSLLVVGAQGSDDSGSVAAKLALALAQDANRVVLADLGDDGKIAASFELGRHRHKDTQPLLKQRIRVRHGGIRFDRFPLRSTTPLMLAVPIDPLPRSISLVDARALVEFLIGDTEILVVHGPAPGCSRSALTWARAVDATVLVIRSEHTRLENVVMAVEGLDPAGTTIVGTVLEKGRL
jgi:capsular polysaccharide biosynthesis protein